jgi:hypothetical protein
MAETDTSLTIKIILDVKRYVPFMANIFVRAF